MAKPPLIFKRSTNTLLRYLDASVAVGDALPSEQRMAELTQGSRAAVRIQEVLMERIYRSDLPPGADFSEAELARAAGASTISVRE